MAVATGMRELGFDAHQSSHHAAAAAAPAKACLSSPAQQEQRELQPPQLTAAAEDLDLLQVRSGKDGLDQTAALMFMHACLSKPLHNACACACALCAWHRLCHGACSTCQRLHLNNQQTMCAHY